MWYIYTVEYYSAIKKNEIVICSNMDAIRDYHAKWSKSETDKHHYHLYVESKIWHKWTYQQKTHRLTDIENRLVVAMGLGGGKGIDRVLG